MTNTTTHVAGPLVGFEKLDRAIQRCAVCGEKLEDMRPSRVMVMSTNGDNSIPRFAEAHLIRVSYGENPKSFIDLGDFREAELPDDFCLKLVELA